MIRIGITLPPYKSETREQMLWSSGLVQNVYFLYVTLQMAGFKVYALGNYTQAKKLKMDHADASSGQRLDVIIELGSVLEPMFAALWRKAGRKIVSHPIGNVMFLNVEHLTGRGKTWHLPQSTYDSVWLLPHFWNTNRAFASMCGKCLAEVVPFIWDSRFVEDVPRYDPSVKKRVGIFEPSVSVVKTPNVPLLVCERADQIGADIHGVEVFAAHPTASLDQMVARMKSGHKVCYQPRMPPQRAFGGLSAVVSHTLENGLNYNWNELVYLGYPLLHNSGFFGGGYKYPTFDCDYGGQLLKTVLEQHDDHAKQYEEAGMKWLEQGYPSKVAPRYKELIEGVLG